MADGPNTFAIDENNAQGCGAVTDGRRLFETARAQDYLNVSGNFLGHHAALRIGETWPTFCRHS
jgi:hypothetical protein